MENWEGMLTLPKVILSQMRFRYIHMDERCAAMECLCNSPQRLRILDVLDDTQMDVRDLMEALNSPRSTVQRNLTVLEERDWIEDRCSGYTTTTIGRLLREEFVSMSETTDTIKRMAPFS